MNKFMICTVVGLLLRKVRGTMAYFLLVHLIHPCTRDLSDDEPFSFLFCYSYSGNIDACFQAT